MKVLRIVNVNDPITKLPGVLLNENFRVLGGRYELPWCYSCYAHVGVEIALEFFEVQNPSSVHDLGTYIDLLRCPKKVQLQKNMPNFLNKAWDSLKAKEENAWLWLKPARNVGN